MGIELRHGRVFPPHLNFLSFCVLWAVLGICPSSALSFGAAQFYIVKQHKLVCQLLEEVPGIVGLLHLILICQAKYTPRNKTKLRLPDCHYQPESFIFVMVTSRVSGGQQPSPWKQHSATPCSPSRCGLPVVQPTFGVRIGCVKSQVSRNLVYLGLIQQMQVRAKENFAYALNREGV